MFYNVIVFADVVANGIEIFIVDVVNAIVNVIFNVTIHHSAITHE